jgi:hypothetical protein
MPQLPYGQYYSYAYNSRITPAWHEAFKKGGLNAVQSRYWLPKAPEEFYDTGKDPHQVRNLITVPAHQQEIGRLREMLTGEMVRYRDAGLIPEAMYPLVSKGKSVGDYVASKGYDVATLKKLADAATSGRVETLPLLREGMKSDNPLQRYWGVIGCSVLEGEAEPAKDELIARLSDQVKLVRVTAAVALGRMGEEDIAVGELQEELKEGSEYELLAVLHGLEQFPDGWEAVKGRLQELAEAGRRKDTSRVAVHMLSQMK